MRHWESIFRYGQWDNGCFGRLDLIRIWRSSEEIKNFTLQWLPEPAKSNYSDGFPFCWLIPLRLSPPHQCSYLFRWHRGEYYRGQYCQFFAPCKQIVANSLWCNCGKSLSLERLLLVFVFYIKLWYVYVSIALIQDCRWIVALVMQATIFQRYLCRITLCIATLYIWWRAWTWRLPSGSCLAMVWSRGCESVSTACIDSTPCGAFWVASVQWPLWDDLSVVAVISLNILRSLIQKTLRYGSHLSGSSL